MSPTIVVYALLAFLCSSSLENVTAEDSYTMLKSIISAVEKLETKIELQADLLNSLTTKAEMNDKFENLEAKVDHLKALLISSNVKEDEQVASLINLKAQANNHTVVLNKVEANIEIQSFLLNNNLATKSDVQVQQTLYQNLEAKAAMHDNSLSKLQTTVDEIKTLLIHSNVQQDEQVGYLSKLESQLGMQKISLDKVGASLENQNLLLNGFVTKEEIQANNLTNMATNVTTLCKGAETFTDEIQNFTASKGIAEGIIAGTSSDVVIIPFDTREQRTISSRNTFGVAFNWQSRKVYWIEYSVGIRMANLDASSSELLISDTSDVWGLAVDQITGNFYYGIRGSNASIRVCDSRGNKCVTIASGVNHVGIDIRDIALFPSQGLMFWSSPYDKKSVTRANMDGSNATVIILEDIYGLDLDEFTERLYWTNYYGKSIGHRDLNGNNRNVLLNTTSYLYDIAVDGDTVYFGGHSPNGVYSVSSNGKVSSIANTTGEVYHMALYGRNKVHSRPNPCKNSPCTNLCVLTRTSYTCL